MKSFIALLAIMTLVCSCQNTSNQTQSTPSLQTPVSASTVSQQQLITTQALTPKPIRITLDSLPKPYATDSASQPPQVVPIPQNPTLNVPQGFQVNIFAQGLNQPRWLALTPTGDVLVTETRQNRIRLLKDTNQDGIADDYKTFADVKNGLEIPFGMAFSQGYFFLGNHHQVRRYSYTEGQEQLQGKGEKITDLPGGGYRQHWTRNVVVSPDGKKLYVSIGSESNAEVEPLPRASVQIMNLDGSDRQTFADGLRNPVGLDFHPLTGQLYTTVNERDQLGDDLVPDYLTGLEKGEFYGWPFSYFTPQLLDPRHVKNGKSVNPELVAKTAKPDV